MVNPYRSLELLAPAGDMTCLHAAVLAGAQAVYLGLGEFNARRGADNFTLENLGEACDFAHLHGTRVFLTVNVVILPDETERALDLVRQAWLRGIDAVIVQDLGLASEIGRTMPEVEMHLSTQANTHDEDGVRAAWALGMSRVTFARELTLSEISDLSDIAHELGMTTESFGHGALCVCYSGQCFMSSMIGGRSANRGMCAQACRLPYTLENEAGEDLPSDGEHLLSPKDLATIDMLPEIAVTGVDSLKIEGRMKSPEYVWTVVGLYRRVLDRLAQDFDERFPGGECSIEDVLAAGHCEGVVPTADELRMLAEAFTRGFTHAYMERARDNGIMSYTRPNNRGVFVGRVADVRDGEVVVASDIELHAGDLVEFWTNKGRFAVSVSEQSFLGGGEYLLPVEDRVHKGDRVFRVRSAELAFVDDPDAGLVPVEGTVRLRIGEPLTIEFACQGVDVRFEGAVVEAARTKAVSAEEVYDHIDRFGNTSFYLDALHIDLDDGVGIGFSALHKARTKALNQLKDALLASYRMRSLPKPEPRDKKRRPAVSDITVAAIATNPACARAAKRAGADAVYVPVLNVKRGTATLKGVLTDSPEQAGYPGRRTTVMPVVDKDPLNRDEAVDYWSYAKEDKPLYVENLGQLLKAPEVGAVPEVGPHIPITNAWSLDVASLLGARRVWLSPELTLRQIADLSTNSPVELGLTVYGYQELMTTEHCLLMSQGPCNQKCGECPRRREARYFKDRKGYRFPIVTDGCGRSHLYNAVALDAAHLLPELIEAGVTSFMVDATLLDADETAEAVARVCRARSLALNGGKKVDKLRGKTTGHLFRAVQ
ncbi:U32 family peptidase [Slackia heliotrinireducens]|uniref:U32 family peptidase n=1 Tax=Slackia heliotrinireducens TaxID=84110 RepID=UPI0033158D86